MTKRSQLFRQVLDTHRLYRLLAGKSCPGIVFFTPPFYYCKPRGFSKLLTYKKSHGGPDIRKAFNNIYIYIRGAHAARLCCLVSHSAIRIHVIGTHRFIYRQEIPVEVQDTLSIYNIFCRASCKFVGSTFAQAHAIPFNKYPPQKSISWGLHHGYLHDINFITSLNSSSPKTAKFIDSFCFLPPRQLFVN